MTVVAHVTDLHLVEHDHHKRDGAAKGRLLYLNTGRKIDPKARFDRVCEALRHASSCSSSPKRCRTASA